MINALILRSAIAATCAVSCFTFPPPSLAETGLFVATDSNKAITAPRLRPCASDRNCVSSSYLEPPNRYVAPLKLVNDRDKAFLRAVRDFANPDKGTVTSFKDNGFSLVEVKPDLFYIHVTTQGTTPGSLDDLELLFSQEGIVNVRCDARVTLPVPPFCLKRNCINGNMDQRRRVEQLAFFLNLPPSDQEQMQTGEAKWTPIFFNSDRVPGFYEDD